MLYNIKTTFVGLAGLSYLLFSCGSDKPRETASSQQDTLSIVEPLYISDPVDFDTDDPAIWVNPADPSQSLILGTDKDQNGGLYVFDLKGKIIPEKTIKGLKRPDNVDIAYGMPLQGVPTDIAVTTERFTHKLRIYSLPDMKPVDNGGLEMFEGQTGKYERDLMGISLYKKPTGELYAIVGRKFGPTDGSYLWQYLLEDDGKGMVKATLVRKFGKFSGIKEIEAIAVDNQLGYIYYSDEGVGVRKYYADPLQGDQELALFAQTGFAEDHEGISIYNRSDSTGYILVSDQGANRFQIFSREGVSGDPHQHKLLKLVNVRATHSDGSDMVSVPLNADFKHGLFVVMSDDKTFHLYRWEDIAGKELQSITN